MANVGLVKMRATTTTSTEGQTTACARGVVVIHFMITGSLGVALHQSAETILTSFTKLRWIPAPFLSHLVTHVIIRMVPACIHGLLTKPWGQDGWVLACCKPRHVCVVKPELLKSWSLQIDYSRALSLGADQKTRMLWERDWFGSGERDLIGVISSHWISRGNPIPSEN